MLEYGGGDQVTLLALAKKMTMTHPWPVHKLTPLYLDGKLDYF